jgi:hypothetical protein
MSKQQIILAEPVRTAIGAFNGTLKSTPATELGAIVIAEAVRRSKAAAESIQSVTMGNVVQAGNRMNPQGRPRSAVVFRFLRRRSPSIASAARVHRRSLVQRRKFRPEMCRSR